MNTFLDNKNFCIKNQIKKIKMIKNNLCIIINYKKTKDIVIDLQKIREYVLIFKNTYNNIMIFLFILHYNNLSTLYITILREPIVKLISVSMYIIDLIFYVIIEFKIVEIIKNITPEQVYEVSKTLSCDLNKLILIKQKKEKFIKKVIKIIRKLIKITSIKLLKYFNKK